MTTIEASSASGRGVAKRSDRASRMQAAGRPKNPGTFEFSRDYRDLFRAHPINTVLVKVAYWLNP